MPKTKSEEAKIDFSGNPFFSGKFPSLIILSPPPPSLTAYARAHTHTHTNTTATTAAAKMLKEL